MGFYGPLGIPRAGTARGDKARDDFVNDLLAIIGDTRLLWIPQSGDTTTGVEKSRYAATITWDASVATRLTTLGSGQAQDFDGTDDEGDIPDADRYSFGDGAADSPFSIIALVNPTAGTAIQQILSKFDNTSGDTKKEWSFFMDESERPTIQIDDNSTDARIGRRDATALTSGALVYLVGTYDGSRAITGLRVFKDGVRVDDTDQSANSYTAMENTTSLVRVGCFRGLSALGEFWDGGLLLIGLCAKELTIDEIWAIKSLINGYYDLSL